MTTKPQYPSRWKVALAARVSSLRSFTYAFKFALEVKPGHDSGGYGCTAEGRGCPTPSS